MSEVRPQMVFRISILIRLTLATLYLALTVPLPFLAGATNAPIPLTPAIGAIVFGFYLLYGALSERVVLDEVGIAVSYPFWVPPFLRRDWSLNWSDIQALEPRFTGQGGVVYYIADAAGQKYLLPMRMAGFARFVAQVEAHTGIETRHVKPLAQPWMYFILLGLTAFLLLVDGWVIGQAIAHGVPLASTMNSSVR